MTPRGKEDEENLGPYYAMASTTLVKMREAIEGIYKVLLSALPFGLNGKLFCVLGFFCSLCFTFRDLQGPWDGRQRLSLLLRPKKPCLWMTWSLTTICPVIPVTPPD